MCDVGYIVKNNVHAVMQLLTVKLRMYNMHLITTKCLNTAVMMMYLFLGETATTITHECDVSIVQDRVRRRLDPPSAHIADALVHDMMSGSERALYYIMMTDGEMSIPRPAPNANANAKRNTNAKIIANAHPKPPPAPYFPGHVFVVERIDRTRFNLYQSYINEYDMTQYVDTCGSLSVGRARMERLVKGMHMLMTKNTWDAECSEFWMDLTQVGAPAANKFMGGAVKGAIHFCYRRVYTRHCVANLRILLQSSLEELQTLFKSTPDAVYGEPSFYTQSPVAPLTVRQLIAKVKKMLAQL